MLRRAEEHVIWIDVVVTVLLTLRIFLLGPTLPRLLDLEKIPSPLARNEEEEAEYFLVAEGRG